MGYLAEAAGHYDAGKLWTPYPKQALAEEYALEVDELLFGGSAGPGKTEWGLEHVIGQMLAYPGNLGGIFRRVYPSLKDVIRRLQFKLHGRADFNKTEKTFTFPNGSVIVCGSLQYEDSVTDYQGWELGVVFFEEMTEFLESQWEFLLQRLRVPSTCTQFVPRPHGIGTTNPGGKGHKWVKRRFVRPKPADYLGQATPAPFDIWRPWADPVIYTDGSEPMSRAFIPATYKDNPALLEKTPDYLAKIRGLSNRGLRLAMETGDWDAIEEIDGALWEWAWLDGGRVPQMRSFPRRVGVAVDPSDGSEKGDAFGVNVTAVGQDGVAYVLYSDQWKGLSVKALASGVVDLYREFQADVVVWEKNFGGKWGPAVVRGIDPNINIATVSAKDGKLTRAEPVAALFAPDDDEPVAYRYRARLVGNHEGLEESLTTFTGKPGESSPDELDALVWNLTELMLGRGEARQSAKVRDERGRGRR